MEKRDAIKIRKDEYLEAFENDPSDSRWIGPIASRVWLFFNKSDILDSQVEDLAAMVLAWLEVRRKK